jgi:hypothetical protein
MTKDSQNLKSVALKTAEISSIQISANAKTATTATPRDRRKKIFALNLFLGIKSPKRENLQ